MLKHMISTLRFHERNFSQCDSSPCFLPVLLFLLPLSCSAASHPVETSFYFSCTVTFTFAPAAETFSSIPIIIVKSVAPSYLSLIFTVFIYIPSLSRFLTIIDCIQRTLHSFCLSISLSSLSIFPSLLSHSFCLSHSLSLIQNDKTLSLSIYLCRYKTYEVLKEQTANPRINWAYLPYSMHMAGPRGKY